MVWGWQVWSSYELAIPWCGIHWLGCFGGLIPPRWSGRVLSALLLATLVDSRSRIPLLLGRGLLDRHALPDPFHLLLLIDVVLGLLLLLLFSIGHDGPNRLVYHDIAFWDEDEVIVAELVLLDPCQAVWLWGDVSRRRYIFCGGMPHVCGGGL